MLRPQGHGWVEEDGKLKSLWFEGDQSPHLGNDVIIQPTPIREDEWIWFNKQFLHILILRLSYFLYMGVLSTTAAYSNFFDFQHFTLCLSGIRQGILVCLFGFRLFVLRGIAMNQDYANDVTNSFALLMTSATAFVTFKLSIIFLLPLLT